MTNHTTFRLTIAALAMAALPSVANACQGPQFESRLVSFHNDAQADIPEGYSQYRVRLSQYDLRDAGARTLIRLSVLPSGDDATERGAIRRLMMVKPVGTSCDSASIPAAGDYYVVGRIARNEAGAPTMINGGALFYPRFGSVRAMQFLQPETQ